MLYMDMDISRTFYACIQIWIEKSLIVSCLRTENAAFARNVHARVVLQRSAVVVELGEGRGDEIIPNPIKNVQLGFDLVKVRAKVIRIETI